MLVKYCDKMSSDAYTGAVEGFVDGGAKVGAFNTTAVRSPGEEPRDGGDWGSGQHVGHLWIVWTAECVEQMGGLMSTGDVGGPGGRSGPGGFANEGGLYWMVCPPAVLRVHSGVLEVLVGPWGCAGQVDLWTN